MACLTRETLLVPLPPKVEKVTLPEFGQDAYVCLRALTAKDMLELEKKHGARVNTENHIAMLDMLAYSLCDERGISLLDGESEQLSSLLGLPLEVMLRLSKVVIALNRLGDSDPKA